MSNSANSKVKLVRYYLANEMIKNRAIKYKVYSKNLTTGKCTIEYMSPVKVMLDKKIYRLQSHVMIESKLVARLKKVDLAIKSKSDEAIATPAIYLSYFSEVDSNIKMNGDFRCYPETMTDESYNVLIHNGYMVRQFTDHFRVTKKPTIQENGSIDTIN